MIVPKAQSVALAVNYSPQASELFRSGRADFDWFKSPDWPDALRDAQRDRPTYVHYDLMAGQGQPAAVIERVRESIDTTNTLFINTHVAPSAEDLAVLSRSDAERQARRGVRADIQQLCDTFGAERVVVENVPWETRPDYPIDRIAAEPEFVSDLLQETGAMLLLDLAHAHIATDELGLQARPFIEAHPTDRLRELHVTGIGEDASGRLRESMPMRKSDWHLLAWALDQIAGGAWSRPWVVTLEYGGVGPHFEWRTDIDILEGQLARCGAMLRERRLRD